MFSTIKLTEPLFCRNAIPPDDADCQRAIADRLQALGSDCDTTVEGPAS